ncbi:trypsin-like peptidase domain-containing protein [Brevibacterium casei]|nr:trypsin-like peptidase domain-containing protein [Brevibacterium casei]
MSSNDGNTSRNRGRHGDDDYRTFPRRSSEVPRTFPSDSVADRSDSTSPRRDSDPSGPDTSQPGQGSGQPTQGQSGQGSGSSSSGYGQGSGQAGPRSDESTRGYPATTGFGASGGDDRTRVQPTYAQNPVDGNGRGGRRASTGQGGTYGSNQGGTHNPSSGYGQTGGYGQSGNSSQSGYGQSRGYDSSAQGAPPADTPPPAPRRTPRAGRRTHRVSHRSPRVGRRTLRAAQRGLRCRRRLRGRTPGLRRHRSAGLSRIRSAWSPRLPAGIVQRLPRCRSLRSAGRRAGQYGSAGSGQYGSSTGSYGSGGQYDTSGQGQYGASGQGQYASAGASPYATDSYGSGGQGPYGGGQRPRREKRGPGWGATIAIALIAALLGGGAAFGGGYAVSAMQEGTESRKVAEQTIETPDWTEVAKSASESVVSIQAAANGRVVALGSGSLYDDQGHVITNNHVVAPSDTPGGELTVTMKNGATMKAEIVGRDPSTDIAIIKLDQVPEGVKPLPIGDSKALSVGDPVMALGNPLGLADSVTTGIVSALDRPVTTENIGDDASSQRQKELTITNAIQTDAAINPGNSGGPLVDGNGNFIGVNSGAASLGQGEEGQQSGSIGIGFAIPASQAVMIADQLIATGKAQHPFLGVRLTDGQINTGGITRASAKVQAVEPGSPAAKAGFQDGDDVIAVGDTKVTSAISLQALVRAQPVNTPVEFTIVRGGQEQKLSVSLILQ